MWVADTQPKCISPGIVWRNLRPVHMRSRPFFVLRSGEGVYIHSHELYTDALDFTKHVFILREVTSYEDVNLFNSSDRCPRASKNVSKCAPTIGPSVRWFGPSGL